MSNNANDQNLTPSFHLYFTEQYNVDKSQISVSGISSGAAFATQIHVIYSSHIMGIGMVAGGDEFIIWHAYY